MRRYLKNSMIGQRIVAASAVAFSTWFALGVVAALLNVPNFAARRLGQVCECLIEEPVYVPLGALELGVVLLVATVSSAAAFAFVALRPPKWILERRRYFAALKRAGLLGMTLALVVVGGIIGESYVSGAAIFAEPSKVAPNFSFVLTDGSIVDLHSYKGRPILLEFMTTSCAYCQLEVAHLKEVQQHFGANVTVIAISTAWSGDTLQAIEQFNERNGITWPSGLDRGDGTKLFDVKGVPKIFLLNERLQIVRTYLGETPADTLIKDLQGIVK